MTAHSPAELSPEDALRAACPDATAADVARLPEHLRAGLARYLLRRISPGRFLRCALENDLAGAVCSADPASLEGLRDLMQFLHCCAPSAAWGSKEAVERWTKNSL